MPSQRESTSPSHRAASSLWAYLRAEVGWMRRAGHEARAELVMAEVAQALTQVRDAHRADFRARGARR